MDKQVALSIIIAVLGSGVLNCLITQLFYDSKLKKDMRRNGPDSLAKNIEESLQEFRKLELKLTIIEIYDVENVLSQKGPTTDFFGGECIYPEIFNDWDSFNAFCDQLHQFRSTYEKNISIRLALNVVFIDRYFMTLSAFMAGNEDRLPLWGTIFIFDLHRWQRRIDAMLVKEINKCNYKLESHSSKKWWSLRKIEVEKQYEETILSFLLTGKCRKKDQERMNMVKQLLVQVLSDDEKDSDS